jgi:hypothetical protein
LIHEYPSKPFFLEINAPDFIFHVMLIFVWEWWTTTSCWIAFKEILNGWNKL